MTDPGSYVIDPPERITKIDQRLQRSSYGMSALLMSLPFIGIGAFFAYAGFVDTDLLDDVNGPVWLMGFVGLMFALPGLVLFGLGLQGVVRNGNTARVRRRYPDQPWRFDYPWHPDGITDSAAERIVTGIVGVLVIGIFLVPFIWWAFISPDSVLMVQIVVWIFLILWVVGLLTLGYRALQFIKYGATYLGFSEFPFQLGGTLIVGLANTKFNNLTVTLRFVEEKLVSRGSAQRRVISHECYQYYAETRRVETTPGEFTRLSFQLLDDQRFANQLIADPAIRYWELVLESDMPGIDFRTTFPLPVYPGRFSAQPNPRFGRMSRGRRWARGMPFESKVIAIPLLLIGAIWLIAPDWTKQAINGSTALVYRVANQALLKPLPAISSSAMCITDALGAVRVLSKYDVTEFPGADQEPGVPLLNRAIYREQFGVNPGAWSTMLVRNNGELWVGGWYGEILVLSDGAWQQLATRETTLLSRIYQMVEFRGEVYLSDGGVWRWDSRLNQPVKVSGNGGVKELFVHSGGLYFSDGNRLGRYDGDSVAYLLEHDAEITALALDANGGYVLGSKKGLGFFTPAGELLESALEDKQITRIRIAAEGMVIVGTLHNGVMLGARNEWFALNQSTGLPEDHITDVVLDGHRRLWIAMYGGGVSTIVLDRLLKQKPL